MHALHGCRLGFVHRLELAARHGTNRNGRDLHAGQSHIDAVLCLPVNLVRRVEPLGGRADQLEVLGVLEHDFVGRGNRQRCRPFRERAVVEPAAGRVVDNVAGFRAAGRGVDAPGLRRRFDKKHARGRTCFAQRLPEGAHRGRAAGHLEAHKGICVKPVVWRRMFEMDLIEIDFEFLGNEHGHGRVGALPHLDLGHDQRDAAIGADADKGVGRNSSTGCVPAAWRIGNARLKSTLRQRRRLPAGMCGDTLSIWEDGSSGAALAVRAGCSMSMDGPFLHEASGGAPLA